MKAFVTRSRAAVKPVIPRGTVFAVLGLAFILVGGEAESRDKCDISDRPYLVGRDFSGCDLRDATLPGTNLAGANLSRVDLGDANLRDTGLLAVDFTFADLTGADFSGAKLNGANLIDARNLTQSQLDRACGDKNTKLDSGLTIKPCDKSD